jgi:hypothetical protein
MNTPCQTSDLCYVAAESDTREGEGWEHQQPCCHGASAATQQEEGEAQARPQAQVWRLRSGESEAKEY